MLGNSIICLMAALMGPIPQLNFFGGHLWLAVLSVGLQGVGSAATYLGSLLHMLSGVQGADLPDTDQTKGMVSSLWIVGICLGGYLGSSLGGLAFDKLGFEVGTLRVTLGLGFSVAIIVLYLLIRRYCRGRVPRASSSQPGEEKRLLEHIA